MPNTVKLGIFMTAALVVVGYLIIESEDLRLFGPEGRRIVAEFETVVGLDDQAPIRMAGVRVGRVDGIRLDGRTALVTLLLEEEVPLTEGTVARVANMGLLGDKFVELVPGPEDAPPLPEKARIPGEAPPGIDQVISSLGQLGGSLQEVTAQLTGDAPARGPLAQTLVNLQGTTSQLQDLLAQNRSELETTMANFHRVSTTLARELPRLADQLEGLVVSVQAVVEENRGQVRRSVDSMAEVTSGLQESVEDLNRITGGLEAGEGTLGKLLKSDEAHSELVATLDSVQTGVASLSETLTKAERLQLDLAMEGMYFENLEESRGAFQIDLETSTDHRYRLGVVDDPRGKEERETRIVTTVAPDGTETTETVETVTIEDDITFTALYGLPLHRDLSVWTGLIESRFGLEFEYAPERRWWLSLEAFDFDRLENRDPHLRFSAGLALDGNLYLLAGYDDPLVDEFRGAFIGGGLRWSDDDLKYLLGSLPRF
ncbi:MAG: MlaD family protein [Thermoanaerobaculia bacterium]|nr:MlaD family protein [Thermoanaerobaculia bacterium]